VPPGETDIDPDNATEDPSIVTVVALVELQVNVALAPDATLDGAAVMVIVGAVPEPVTVTATESEAVPPAPMAVAV